MIKVARLVLCAYCAFFLSVSESRAELIDRGGGLIYDTVLNVTWLQDADYASTTGAAPWGVLGWNEAVSWASDLQYFDSVRGVFWDDWRLPTTVNDASSEGWDTTGQSSELAWMYYGNLGYAANTHLDTSEPLPTSSNYNPFINLHYRGYFSGTLSPVSDQRAWITHFHFGLQYYTDLNDAQFVWAVRDGDVAAGPSVASVPEPATLGLVGLGMAGAGLVRRRQKQKA